MPPRGVKKGTKRERQYEAIKDSARSRGASTGRAEEIAARTVQRSAPRRRDADARGVLDARQVLGPARRGAWRPRDGRRRADARRALRAGQVARVEGRSKMNKRQLARAVGRKAS